jgi:hypothetical protein
LAQDHLFARKYSPRCHGKDSINQPTDQPTTTTTSSTNLRDQKPRRLPPRLIAVQEMPRRNNQRTPANIIRQATVNLDPIVRKLRNPAAVLRVLGIPKQHDALDLLADRGAELRDRVAHHRGALAVAAGDDGGPWAFGRGEREEALGFVDGRARGARGQSVVEERRAVGSADALDPDVARAVLRAQGVGYGWPG